MRLRRDKPVPLAQAPSPPPPPLPPRLIGIGHSHLVALQESVTLRDAQAPDDFPPTRFLQMLTPDYSPTLGPDRRLNPALTRAIEVLLAEAPNSLLFDCISGNEYHFIGLVRHPRPYDFVLLSRPDLPLQPDAEIIPARLMRQALEAQAADAIACLEALRKAADVPIWHVQSPPPIPSDDYIRANPAYFAEQVQVHGVAKAALRMKLWLLQSEIYRACCERIGIGFLPVPPAVCDPEGFLLEAGWPPDPAHANAWYGGHVMDRLSALLASHHGSRTA